MLKSFTKAGKSSSDDTAGTTFLPLRSASQDFLITLQVRSAKLEKSSNRDHADATFSVQSYTLTGLCMCTDYSKPLTGQIPLQLELSLTACGGSFASSLGVHKCVQCDHPRPYAITALSIALRS